jgi:hypothetical protein
VRQVLERPGTKESGLMHKQASSAFSNLPVHELAALGPALGEHLNKVLAADRWAGGFAVRWLNQRVFAFSTTAATERF